MTAIARPAEAPAAEARPRRLRSRRVRVKELQLGPLVARARHSAFGALEASVEDLSLYGMALVVSGAAAHTSMVLSGDLLQPLRLEFAGSPIYDGVATVRHVSERGDDLVLGVELQSGGVHLADLYRLGERLSFAERLRAVEGDAVRPQVSAQFKAWVAEARTYLESMKMFLDEEERKLTGLDRQTREEHLKQYLQESAPLVIGRMNAASAELARLVCNLEPVEHPAYRAFLRGHLLSLLAHSPLLRRSAEKPLGYAGDYEMMNMLYRDHAEGDSLFGRVLNLYAAQEPAAQANINRLGYLGARIRLAVASSRAPRVRIASIGCGPAREIVDILEQSPELGRRLDIALIDQEERVITFCERTLGPLAARTGARVQLIRESVRRLLTTRQLSSTLGARDFIYSAGLFDYLNHRSFEALLGSLYEALAPGGSLAVGNVAANNPTRWFMEYCLDWFLIHRTPEELLRFGRGLGPKPGHVDVESEPLGVNLFLLVRR